MDTQTDWDRMEYLTDEIYYHNNQDTVLISELVGLGFRLIGRGSMRSWELDRLLKRYQKLKQPAAMKRVMADIHRIVYGLKSEISNCRPRNVRGGSTDQ